MVRLRLSICTIAALAAASGIWADEAPERIQLAFEKTPIVDAVATLGAQLDTLIILSEGIAGEVTASFEIERDRALLPVAGQVGARPQRAILFCTEEEARGKPELTDEEKAKTVSLTLEPDALLPDALVELGKVTELTFGCTEALGDTAVTIEATDQPLPELLDATAESIDATWVVGWKLVPVTLDQIMAGLESFLQLPEDQRKGLFDSMLGQAMDRYHQMPPEQRKQMVQTLVGAINGFGQRLRQADPATQQRFRQMAGPLIGYGVQRFATFNAQDQAELMPVMRAFGALR